MKGLSAAGLADLAGATEVEVQRLVKLGILAPRDGTEPFLETDVQKVRLAIACQQAGVPMAGIAAAIRSGRLSFAFLEAAVYRPWAVRSTRTYRWTEQLVATIEAALEDTGVLGRPERVPAMCFLDLVGYTRLTEEHGDQAAAALAGRLAVLSALQLVAQLAEAGLPPAHVGVRPGRWWSRAATTSAAPSTWPPGSPPMPAPVGSW